MNRFGSFDPMSDDRVLCIPNISEDGTRPSSMESLPLFQRMMSSCCQLNQMPTTIGL